MHALSHRVDRPFAGIDVPPCWKIVPPGRPKSEGDGIRVIIEPGEGFGDGAHPTTQLCLQAIATLAPRGDVGWRMLDFGSGTGILAIAATKLGAIAEAVEIDEMGLEDGERNARLNAVADRIRWAGTLEETPGPFDMVVGNILRSVLLEHAEQLTARLAAGGTLILSGLVSTDVPEVSVRYASMLNGGRPQVFERDPWRALAWLPERSNR